MPRIIPANILLGGLILIAGLRVAWPNRDMRLVESMAGQEVAVRGKLYDDPDQTNDGLYKVRMKNLTICRAENDCSMAEANVFATFGVREIKTLDENATLERGDTVILQGKLKPGFGAFAGTIYRGEVVSYSKSNPPDKLLKIRNWFSGLVEKHIPVPESALALGYLLGQKRALPEALLQVLAVTGLTHIVVASGANLTIITRMLRRLFGRSRRLAFVTALIAVGLMIGIIGLAPSLVRAGLVAVLALVAWYFGRPVHPVRLILLAATTTLIANPTFILDLGWQLSFAAFGGVLLIAPVLAQFLYGEGKPRALAQIAIETAAATIATLPILLYNFGYVSLISLIPNLLILPTIPLAMLLTFATGMLAIGVAPAAALLGWLATWVLKYNLWVINWFGEMQFATLKVAFAWWQAALMYAVILGLWWALKTGTRARLMEINVVE